MSESGETPSGAGIKTKRIDRFRQGFSIMMSADYDRHVDPNFYDDRQRRGSREILGREVVGVLSRYLPALNAQGEKPKVLDMAAGTGIISEVLKNQGYDVTATDLSRKAIDFLADKFPDIKTVQADMNEALPIEDDKFDGVTTVWGNRFIKDTDAFLSEVRRVLKPGGIFAWPLFPTEISNWKLRNGVGQHTGINTLSKDAQAVGFSVVEKINFLTRCRKQPGLPLIHTPGYLILKK